MKEARACYQAILDFAPDSPTAADAKSALQELDQSRPIAERKKKALNLVIPSRFNLPPVLNLNGAGEFPRLEPLRRTSSPDLVDEENGSLDDGLVNRNFSLPEERIGL